MNPVQIQTVYHVLMLENGRIEMPCRFECRGLMKTLVFCCVLHLTNFWAESGEAFCHVGVVLVAVAWPHFCACLCRRLPFLGTAREDADQRWAESQVAKG